MWKPKPGDQAIVVKVNAAHSFPVGTRITLGERLNNRLFVVRRNLNPNDKQILDVIEFAPA